MRPGDLIGFETRGLFALLIRTGQRLGAVGVLGYLRLAFLRYVLRRPWPKALDWTRTTHIAVVSEIVVGDVRIRQAVRRIDEVLLSSYGRTPWSLIAYPDVDRDRSPGLAFTALCLGMDYGVLSVVSRALNYLTPKRIQIDFSREGRMDCSTFGARTWEHMGHCFDRGMNPWRLTPGDLKREYGGAA